MVKAGTQTDDHTVAVWRSAEKGAKVLANRAGEQSAWLLQSSALVVQLHGDAGAFGDRVALDRAVSVLAEDRVAPHRVLDGQEDESADRSLQARG